MIDKISNVFDYQDRMFSSMDSISTMTKEYMNQNKVKFDMNDILFVIHIDLNQSEYVMVNVVEIENLFDLDFHNHLDINSKKTTDDKDIGLKFLNQFLMKSKNSISYIDNRSTFSYQVQY